MRPVIGIIGNAAIIGDDYPVHAAGTMNVAAVADVAGAMPLIIPAHPDYVSVDGLLDACDGIVLTGGRPNVHPEDYGETPTPAHGAFCLCRNKIVLPLVRASIDRGQPLFAICRGCQWVTGA